MKMTTTADGSNEESPPSFVVQEEVPLSAVVPVDLNEESTSSSLSSGTLPQSNMDCSDDTSSAAQAIEVSDDADDAEAEDESDDKTLLKPVVVNRCKKRTGVPQNMGRNRHALLKKDQCVLLDGIKFMAEFDPTNSSRNQQKKKKRYHPVDGRLIQYADDYDICDCLNPACPGCHYPCKSCGDGRCGKECRVQRKWMYDSLEIDGRDKEIKNPHSSAFV